MSFRRLVFSAIVSLAMVYAAYPYFALYRLVNAVSAGDAEALSTLVAWHAVREGVKEDICDAALDMPAAEAGNSAALRPFGYSFVRGIAANVVEANITPEALVSAARSSPAEPSVHAEPAVVGNGMKLNWAFFNSPRQFSVAFGMPGQTGPDSELRIQMELRRATWVVTRAWLPSALLLAANTRT